MTFGELKKKNPDIILDPVPWDQISDMANGAVMFYVSLRNGNKPIEERQVLWAGHIMTCGMRYGGELMFTRITSHGNSTLDSVTRDIIEKDRRCALFFTRPIPEHDQRNLEPWNRWY